MFFTSHHIIVQVKMNKTDVCFPKCLYQIPKVIMQYFIMQTWYFRFSNVTIIVMSFVKKKVKK